MLSCHRWVPEVPLRPRRKTRRKGRPNRIRSSFIPSCKGEVAEQLEGLLYAVRFGLLRPAPCSESRLEMPGLKEGRASTLIAEQVQIWQISTSSNTKRSAFLALSTCTFCVYLYGQHHVWPCAKSEPRHSQILMSFSRDSASTLRLSGDTRFCCYPGAHGRRVQSCEVMSEASRSCLFSKNLARMVATSTRH